MPKLFINYRREDSEIYVALLHERLTSPDQGLQGWEIFRDIDSLEAGEFRRNIQKFLVNCDVVLVVIGPRWKEILDERDAAVDVARDEIKIALNSDAAIIPVLVGGASLPDFPRDLVKLADLNTFTVRSDPDFDADMERLMRAISHTQAPAPPKKKRGIRIDGNIQLMLSIAVVLFLGGLLGRQLYSDRGGGADTDDRNATQTAVASTAVAAANVTQTVEAETPVPTSTITVTATGTLAPNPTLPTTDTTTPPPTETPIPAVPLDLTAAQFQSGSFEGSAGQVRFTQGCETRPDGISATWDVSRVGSYAGSVVDIPPEIAAALEANMDLVLWAESENEAVRFEVGLRSSDGNGHNKVIFPENRPDGRVSVPLAEFAPFGVDLTQLSGLIVAFSYDNGETSRQGAICIGGFGFSSP